MWCTHSGLRLWHLSVDSGEISRHVAGAEAVSPSQRRDFFEARLFCRLIPTRPKSPYLQRKGNFLVSLTLCSLELLCTVLWLRVVLDSRLTWRKHGNIKVKKAHNSLWDCRRAFCATWGLRPKVVCWLQLSINRPSTAFVTLVWPDCQAVGTKKRLNRTKDLYAYGQRQPCALFYQVLRRHSPAFPHLIQWFTAKPDRLLIDPRVWGADCTFNPVNGTSVRWCGFRSRIIYLIIIIITIINCNRVVTLWQWLFYMYTKYDIGY